MSSTIFVLLGLVLVLGLWAISAYNHLIRQRELVRNAMSQIAAQVESRWDALSSLISATKQYAAHEAATFSATTTSRNPLSSKASVSAVESDQTLFNKTMTSLFAVAEGYPDLKASAVYENTMEEVSKYEDHVRHSRMIYNDTVTKYNRSVQTIPTNIAAALFDFQLEDYFQSSSEKNQTPSWEA